MPTEPTPWEIWRRIDEIVQALSTTASEMRQLRTSIEETYVRRDNDRLRWEGLGEWRKANDTRLGRIEKALEDAVAVSRANAGRLDDLEQAHQETRSRRWQMWLALVGAALGLAGAVIAGIVVAVATT